MHINKKMKKISITILCFEGNRFTRNGFSFHSVPWSVDSHCQCVVRSSLCLHINVYCQQKPKLKQLGSIQPKRKPKPNFITAHHYDEWMGGRSDGYIEAWMNTNN